MDTFQNAAISEKFDEENYNKKKLSIQNTLQFHRLSTNKDYEVLFQRLLYQDLYSSEEDFIVWMDATEEEIIQSMPFNPDLLDNLIQIGEFILLKNLPEYAMACSEKVSKTGERYVRWLIDKAYWCIG